MSESLPPPFFYFRFVEIMEVLEYSQKIQVKYISCLY